MLEIPLNGNVYRIGKLSALNQGQLARRIGPLVPHAIPAIRAFSGLYKTAQERGDQMSTDEILDSLGSVAPLTNALSDLKDDAFEQIVVLCTSVVQRQQGQNWAAIARDKTLMFSDIEFDTLLPLVVQTIRYNLGNFIAGLVSKGSPPLNPAPEAPAPG